MRISKISGFTVITHPMPSPIATVRVMVNAGSYQEIVPGTAHFLEHMFFKGTELRGYEELNRLLASIGNSNAFTCQDMTAFYIDTTGPNVLRAFDLLVEMMFLPTMDASEMDKERTVILEECQTRQDDPANFFFDGSTEFLFGEKLGHEIVGTNESILGMTRDDLMGFRETHYNRENIAFVLVGDVGHISESDLAKSLAPFSNLTQGYRNEIPTLPLNLGRASKPVALSFKHVSTQAWLSLWTPGFDDEESHRLYDAPSVLYDALGGGMHSLLFNRIREELGLAYSTGTTDMNIWGNALEGCFALLKQENVEQCLVEILKLLHEVARNGIPPDILEASLSHFEFCAAQEAQTPSQYTMAYTTGYFQNLELESYEERMRRFRAARQRMPELVQRCAGRLVEGLAVTVMNGPGA
jgi:predicted Zn-dependent peptidase